MYCLLRLRSTRAAIQTVPSVCTASGLPLREMTWFTVSRPSKLVTKSGHIVTNKEHKTNVSSLLCATRCNVPEWKTLQVVLLSGNQLINQLINQTINQSIEQSTKQSINQSTKQSINQSIDQYLIYPNNA